MALTQVQGGMLAGSSNTVTTIQSNGTTAITIDASQNVGVGTNSPTQKLDVSSSSTGGANIALTKSNSGTANQGGQVLYFNNIGPAGTGRNDGVFIGTIYWQASQPSSGALQDAAQISCVAESQSGNNTASSLRFYTNTGNSGNAERMRIAADGGIYLGTTTNGGATGITFSNASDSASFGKSMYMNSPYNGTRNAISFAYNSSGVGQIITGTNSVGYQSNSDYRLKENVAPMTGALSKVSALKPVTYKWKSDGSNGQGFIAHELQAIVPDCVTGEKDAVDADGKPVYQGVDTSFLVATLTAAIQELNAKVDAQAAEIAALKAAK